MMQTGMVKQGLNSYQRYLDGRPYLATAAAQFYITIKPCFAALIIIILLLNVLLLSIICFQCRSVTILFSRQLLFNASLKFYYYTNKFFWSPFFTLKPHSKYSYIWIIKISRNYPLFIWILIILYDFIDSYMNMKNAIINKIN